MEWELGLGRVTRLDTTDESTMQSRELLKYIYIKLGLLSVG